nr:MAG TPA: hypothetical protein [Caudoviricetes sp.]
MIKETAPCERVFYARKRIQSILRTQIKQQCLGRM